MSRIDRLIEKYRQAQEELLAEAGKPPKGTHQEYRERLLAKTAAIFAAVFVYTRKWSRGNVRALYSEGMKESADAVKRQYAAAGKKALSFRGWTAADDAAVAASQANIDTLLMEAVDAARQHMQTEIQQAALRATEEAMTKGQATQVMQAQLIHALKAKGIESVSYVRNGKNCYMQLGAYAELVARTTEHEIRNTANINLGERIGNHLVRISSHSGACPICTPYQGRVYSTDLSDERYPYLYDTPFSREYQNFHPRCRHVVTQYIEELHTPEENASMREFSNRAFDVGGSGWTKKQAEAAEKSLERYRLKQARNRRLYEDQKQYERYRLVLGDDAPKTFSVFRRIKAADGEKWQGLQRQYEKFNNATGLQEQLPFVYNGKKAFIPKNTMITSVKVIAGAGVKRKIDVVGRLIIQYGGTVEEWTKRVGKVENDQYIFDVHWYERNGVQYQAKIKHIKEKE